MAGERSAGAGPGRLAAAAAPLVGQRALKPTPDLHPSRASLRAWKSDSDLTGWYHEYVSGPGPVGPGPSAAVAASPGAPGVVEGGSGQTLSLPRHRSLVSFGSFDVLDSIDVLDEPDVPIHYI